MPSSFAESVKSRRLQQSRQSPGWMLAAVAGAGLLLTAVMTVAQPAPIPPGATPPAAAAPVERDPNQAGATATPPGVKPATQPATKPATLGRAMPKPVPVDPNELTDEKIGNAIRKGADWLVKQFDAKTNTVAAAGPGATDETYHGGLDSLAVYALMQAGLALSQDPEKDKRLDLKGEEMRKRIDAMCSFDLNKGHPQTYAHGLRSTALSLLLTERDEKTLTKDEEKKLFQAYRQVMQADAYFLLASSNGGNYTYQFVKPPPEKGTGSVKTGVAGNTVNNNLDPLAPQNIIKKYLAITPKNLPAPGAGDNSNAQYGLLGVWSAAEAGMEVPDSYWAIVDNHWQKDQLKDGQWPYSKGAEGAGKISMNAAGLASTLVTYDYLVPAIMSGNKVAREPFSPWAKKGLGWFETGDNAIQSAGGYATYGIERVGLASGFKHFGKNDWYRVHAARIVKGQKADGAFGDIINHCYELLFLSRGRHPIIMNKLRWDGYWANRPRDAARLAHYVGRKLEKPLNYQVLSIDTPWEEWTDGPILSIASNEPVKLTKEQLDKIRSFVEAGGMLFTNPDGDSASFNTFAGKLCKDLFGGELENVPPTHPIYTSESLYNVKPPPPMKMYTNGARILMLHAPKDLSRWWQQRDDVKHKPDFDLGANMFIYNAGKRDLRNRINPAWVNAPKTAPVQTVKVARIEYAGGKWDPEPGAWRRQSNWMQRDSGYKIDTVQVKLADLKPTDAPLATLTGTVAQNWNAEHAAALKAYVEAGGVVLIDNCGGSGPFDQSAQALIKAALPGAVPEQISGLHPLLTAGKPGMEDLSKVGRRLRQSAITRYGQGGGWIMSYSAGKGRILYSTLDITSGLLGVDTAGIIGYEPTYAANLASNVVFWTLDGQPGKATAPEASAADAGAK